MIDQNLEKCIYCAEQISLAYCTVYSSLETVKFIFRNREYSEIYYSNNEVKEMLVEVQLNYASLFCLFDKNNICTSSVLYPDDEADLPAYIKSCSQLLNYDQLLAGWIMKDCYISKTNEGRIAGLAVQPVKPKPTT